MGPREPPILPGITISRSLPKCLRTVNAVSAGRLPALLALVEIKGPANCRHNALTTGCALTRTARVDLPPRKATGTQSAAGATQVIGPGHADKSRRRTSLVSIFRYGSICEKSAAIRMKPLLASLPFNIVSDCTAAGFNGSHPRPNTPSVGYAIMPPSRRWRPAHASLKADSKRHLPRQVSCSLRVHPRTAWHIHIPCVDRPFPCLGAW